jgi:F-type H+-transporting ATPase subunit b
MTIDWWTLGIQAVNVVILIWLLGRFFWRPLAALIELRRAAAQQTLDEVEAKRREATAALAEIERTRTGFAQERDAILAAAQAAAEQARAALLNTAAKEATTREAAAKASIEKERLTAEKDWRDRAGRLAVDIAGRLVARLDSVALRAAFLDSLLEAIRALPEPVRQTITANGVALEAISAAPIEPADQERYRTLIGQALGAAPRIVFTVDSSLIAGLELHGPHLLLSNSWRADLTRILADMSHDDRP